VQKHKIGTMADRVECDPSANRIDVRGHKQQPTGPPWETDSSVGFNSRAPL
jgi:hypothetical protein